MDPEVKKLKLKPIPRSERTPAQIEAAKKMYEGLRAKREANKKIQEEEASKKQEETIQQLAEQKAAAIVESRLQNQKSPGEPPAPVPLAQEKKQRQKRSEYLTKQHLDSFKQELLSSMTHPQVEKQIEKIIERPVEKIIEKPIEKIIEREKVVHLSGNALLDKIFFNR
jgi:centrosomal protein CEP164